MDCAGFEVGLTRVLAEPEAIRDSALRRELQAHGEGCAACRPSLPLLEIALRPPGQRDPQEPPAGYWDDFDARLSERLKRRSPIRGRWWAAAAAIVVLVGGGAWIMTTRNVPAPGVEELGRIVDLMERTGREPALGFDDSGEGWWSATEGLDLDVRDELIRWLDEEAGQGEGGSV